MADVASSDAKVQVEALRFNGPVSEFSVQSIAALANWARDVVHPVGSVIASMLTEATFTSETGSGRWYLADGRSAVGTRYQTLTGNSNVPDLRGVFIRGKNNGRLTNNNPDGELALGAYTADKYASHNHGITDPGHIHGVYLAGVRVEGGNTFDGATTPVTPDSDTTSQVTGITVNDSGSNETAPRNVTLNYFIRVN